MNTDKQRVTIAGVMGFTGCVDSECDFRKCQHLHKDGKVYFPEPYSTSRYPDYPGDLNAMHEAEKKLTGVEALRYGDELNRATKCFKHVTPAIMCMASAPQRAEAFLRTIGKWEEE